jgi:hypothetical protein
MNTFTNTFRLYPLGEDLYVNVIFKVEEKKNKYYIDFEYNFEDKLSETLKNNIMKNLNLYDNTIDSYYEGDIIHKNSLTEQLISYMLLSDEELKKYSGYVMSECYRLSLINTIKLLWD